MLKKLIIGFGVWAIVFGVTLVTSTPPLSASSVDPCAGSTLGYWPMNEETGNIVHDICNGFDGSFSQGVSWGADSEGPYLQFSSGDGPRVEVNAPALSQNTSITVELRMQAVGLTETRVISQMLKPDGTLGGRRWILKLEGRQLEVWGETGSNGFPDSPFGSFPGGTNTWTHVAWQIDGNQVWLYYDGVLEASGTMTSPQTLRSLDAITEFGSGERIGGFAGKIQYVRISSGIRNDFLLARPPENQPPVAEAGGPYTVEEGGTVALDGSGSSDPDGDPLTFVWDLDNDGSFETAGQNPPFDATGRDGPDSQTVVLQVCDDMGECDTTSTTVTINNGAPTASFLNTGPVDEGDTATVSFSNQTDPSSADIAAGFSYSYDFGDDGTFEVTGSSADSATVPTSFLEDGPDSLTVRGRIKDKDGDFTEYTTTIVVNNAMPLVTAGSDATIDEGATFSGSGSFTDPGADTWTATVDYGDGTGIQPLPLANKSFDLSHTYGDNGNFTVTVCVTDDDGDTGCDSLLITVHNVAPAVNAPTVSPSSSEEGSDVTASASFSDLGVNDAPFTCTVNYGDGSGDLAGTVSDNICTGPAHTYLDNGTYVVTVVVTDKDGDTGTNTTTHSVSNVAPTVGAITAPLDPVEVNTEISASAVFTDSGVLDTHTAVWDWGDGSTSTGIVTETGSSGSVSGSHTYTAAGVYTLNLTVTDKDGGIGQSVFEFVVVFDPSAGFVTGAGVIDSPAGAYTPDPSLTGIANFGFVSKYQKGATTPSGQTQFRFRMANLDFDSTSYEWLVISGARAQYKGTGTINHSGDYGFMLTAIDGQINGGGGEDKFRIKIWDKATDVVIYDNQLGDADDTDPTMEIRGGSIVIHK